MFQKNAKKKVLLFVATQNGKIVGQVVTVGRD